MERRVLPVETDPEKLVNYVCGSNIMKEGENIKLQPDSEYPEWLWDLNIGKSDWIAMYQHISPIYYQFQYYR